MKEASWQGYDLWSADVCLASIDRGGLLGWYANFPESSPFDSEIDLSGYATFASIKKAVSDLAKEKGYLLVSNKKGLESFKKARPDLV